MQRMFFVFFLHFASASFSIFDKFLVESECDGPPVWMIWPWPASHFLGQQTSAFESVLHNHPGARVIMLSNQLDGKLFDLYVQQGYCVMLHSFSLPEAVEVVASAALDPDQHKEFFSLVSAAPQSFFLPTMHLAVHAIQGKFGGLFVPLDGIMLNTVDYFIPAHGNPTRDDWVLIPEWVVGRDSGRVTLDRSDYQRMPWQRSWMDRQEGATVACATDCIRWYSEKGSGFSRKFVAAAVWQMLTAAQGIFSQENAEKAAAVDLHSVLTAVVKDWLIEQDLRPGEPKLCLLPNWVLAEPKFPDHWKRHGSSDSFLHASTDLYYPRKEKQDWWLILSSKLWLPLSQGAGWEMNPFEKSVAALARQHFRISPSWKGPLFRRNKNSVQPDTTASLLTPLNITESLMVPDQFRIREFRPVEAGLPGPVGGYRTFKHVRVVNANPNSFYLLEISGQVQFFCRGSEGPEIKGKRGLSVEACRTGISTGIWRMCGSPSQLNAAVNHLSYVAASANTTSFTDMTISLSSDCQEPLLLTSRTISALTDNPADLITVVAHSAERCFLHKRLAASFANRYPELKFRVTCECVEGDTNCPEGPVEVSGTAILDDEWEEPTKRLPVPPTLQVVQVPYDFGLSRAKSHLIATTMTEFVLVLDDDFTLDFMSCLECMLLHMRSKWQEALPLDIVGFPVLEDERAFGAFRGSFRQYDQKLFLEPFSGPASPDGCVRVEFCPMVFLGRTERMKTFPWPTGLPVGEHEKFFYQNKYHGLQTGVCFDSSFPHFRVNATSPSYSKRRERMRGLMAAAFAPVGISQVYYLFHKYSHASGHDFDELASKGLEPYSVRDDAGDAKRPSPGNFKLMMICIFSSAGEEGRNFRKVLREDPNGYLRKLVDGEAAEYFFAVPFEARGDPRILSESEEQGDIMWVPSDSRLRFVFELLRDFMFMWLTVVDESTAVDVGNFYSAIGRAEPANMKILGDWSKPGNSSASFFVLSRDIHQLLSLPDLAKYLADGPTPQATIENWISPIKVQRIQFPGEKEFPCVVLAGLNPEGLTRAIAKMSIGESACE